MLTSGIEKAHKQSVRQSVLPIDDLTQNKTGNHRQSGIIIQAQDRHAGTYNQKCCHTARQTPIQLERLT